MHDHASSCLMILNTNDCPKNILNISSNISSNIHLIPKKHPKNLIQHPCDVRVLVTSDAGMLDVFGSEAIGSQQIHHGLHRLARGSGCRTVPGFFDGLGGFSIS